MNQQRPAPSATPSRGKAFLETLKYFYFWHFRPSCLAILYLVMDLALASVQLTVQLISSLWRVVRPVLALIARYILVRLVILLLFLYLGSKIISLIF